MKVHNGRESMGDAEEFMLSLFYQMYEGIRKRLKHKPWAIPSRWNYLRIQEAK